MGTGPKIWSGGDTNIDTAKVSAYYAPAHRVGGIKR